MKILIGTPVHISKDYSMKRWLENVAKLQLEYPADLFLVDNSPGTDYVEKVKEYCAKYGIKNYKIEHLEINQSLHPEVRIERSEEIIRQEILIHDYDAWFSWECDQIIPTDALDKLIKLMKAGNFMMVVHNSWDRQAPAAFNTDMGITLIKKDVLKKHGFLPKPGSERWRGPEAWFKERVLRSGGNYIDVYGIIKPIYHLKNN